MENSLRRFLGNKFAMTTIGVFGVVLLGTLGFQLQPASALSVNWDGGGDGINWSDCLNWNLDVCPTSGDAIMIDSNAGTASTVHLDINFVLDSTTSINVDSDDFLFIDEGVTLENQGTVTNAGMIENDGIITNTGDGVIENSGNVYNKFGAVIGNYLGGTIRNDGSIINDGILDNLQSGTIENAGTIQNNSLQGGTINNAGLIDNLSTGLIDNRVGGTIDNKFAGQIINSGTLVNEGSTENAGSIDNTGEIYNDFGGTVNNKGTIENEGSSSITNGGVINNDATINNSGTITNVSGGSINNNSEGTFTNNPAGIIENRPGAVIENLGVIENDGKIDNISNLNNSPGGILNNPGYIENRGTIYNDVGSTINNESPGTIENRANIENTDGASIQNDGVIDSYSRIINRGGIVSSGIIKNHSVGSISNSDSSSVENTGTIDNDGFISIGAGFRNTGSIANDGRITISASGILNNDNAGDIENGGYIQNTGYLVNTGTIDNTGLIDNFASGTIDNRGGSIDNSVGEIENGCAFILGQDSITGHLVIELCDTDSDGIANYVDTSPGTFSDDFYYERTSGPTFGSIIDGADLFWRIHNDGDPSNGVYVEAVSPISTTSVGEVAACDFGATFLLTMGDEMVITCGSVTSEILSGPVEAQFNGDNAGCVASANIDSGNEITFYPKTCTFSAPSTNADTIILTIGTTQISVAPGSTIAPVIVDVKPGSNPATINLKIEKTITVAILGNSNFDVNTIDKTLSTVLFGHSLAATPAQATKISISDINQDGIKDFVAQFKLSQTNLVSGDTMGCIKAKLKASAGGATIEGCDAIRVIKG